MTFDWRVKETERKAERHSPSYNQYLPTRHGPQKDQNQDDHRAQSAEEIEPTRLSWAEYSPFDGRALAETRSNKR